MKLKFLAVAGALGVSAFAFAPTASAQYYAGYGNGNHDLQPHLHTIQTPFGGYSYYGNGAHDLYSHGHTASPYGGVHSYSNGPFSSTTSHNGYPGYSGFGSYNSGYGGFGAYNSGYSSRFNRGYGRRFNRW